MKNGITTYSTFWPISAQYCISYRNPSFVLFCFAEQMTGFYMKCKTGLKWINLQQFRSKKNHNITFKQTETVIQRCSVKKVFLKISQNSQENNCARVFLLIKLLAWKRLWHRRFSVDCAKFLRTPIFIDHLWWLVLKQKWPDDFFYNVTISQQIKNETWNENLKWLI